MQSPAWREVLIATAALDTGLLAAFGEGATPDEAAAAAGLAARPARIVATALRAMGLLEPAAGDGLRLTPAGGGLLRPDGDDDPAGELMLEERAIRSHLHLAEVLRGAAPPDDVSAGDGATRLRFMRAMRDVAAPRAATAVAALGPPPPGARLLDVGGAPGTYARAFAAAGWDVTVLDLPESIEVAGPDLRAAGVAAVGGDATAALPDGPWDVVYIGNVAHLLGPAQAAALIARAGAALRPGGLLAVQEVLGDESPQGPGFGVMMLVSTAEGDAYPRARYERWMAAAGCPPQSSVSIQDGQHHLLLGRREDP